MTDDLGWGKEGVKSGHVSEWVGVCNAETTEAIQS